MLYSNQGQILMYEGNYQQLYYTFVDFCSSQGQILMFHHFLEQLDHKYVEPYIYLISKDNFWTVCWHIALVSRQSAKNFNISGFLITVPILIFADL